MNRIEWVLDRVEGPTVLDLGAVQHDAEHAGDCDWLHGRLVDEFEEVVGVDYLQAPVNRLRHEGYDVRCADVTSMDIDVGADTVVAGELIEHVANPGEMLARVRDHLEPGGRVVLTTPNPWAVVNLRRVLESGMKSNINDEHVAWYGPRVLDQLFGRYGFEIVEMTTVSQSGHRGLQRLAQLLTDHEYFTGTTWCCVATKETQ